MLQLLSPMGTATRSGSSSEAYRLREWTDVQLELAISSLADDFVRWRHLSYAARACADTSDLLQERLQERRDPLA